MNYDILILGSGPAGYVAAIRAAQLGMKTAIVERSELGGICLNWGCIPTKSLLKSGQIFEYAQHAADYGVTISGEIKADLSKMVERSREVAATMSKGIQFLLKKNKVEIIKGFGKLVAKNTVQVLDNQYTAKHILIATGARSRELPNLPQDGKKIIGYRQALTLSQQPKSMLVVGSGAIGSEFAYFYNSIGTQVTQVEFMPTILPLEDEEVSKQVERSFKKAGIKVLTSSTLESVDINGEVCKVKVQTPKGEQIIETEIVLSAVGITANIENIGLEDLNITVEKGRIKVDEFYRTNVEGVYAFGDCISSPALAHVASAEGIICIEKIAGLNPEPLDYKTIPACTYITPEVASTGLTEKKAKELGYQIKVGKFPFSASGKANAAGAKEGFVKLIFEAKYGEVLGSHLVGANVTEMIAELVLAQKLESTAQELLKTMHPHPTMSEAIMEAAAAALGEVIHL